MLELQVEGLELAKLRGVYKGRKPTAMAKGDEVLALQGLPRGKADEERHFQPATPPQNRKKISRNAHGSSFYTHVITKE